MKPRQPVRVRRKTIPLKPDHKTRRAIFAAAIALFGERGLKGTTAREIARRAKTLPSLIHYHFGSKERLWEECADFIHDELYARLKQRVEETSGLDPGTRVKVLIREYVMAAAADSQVLRFMHRYGVETSAARRTTSKARRGTRVAELVIAHVKEAQASGHMIGAIDPTMLERLIAGAAVYFYDDAPIYERLTKRKVRDPAVIEEHIAALTTLFFAGVRST